MDVNSEKVKRWKCVYPIYFDADKSVSNGRRLPKSQCISKPTCQHLLFACEKLGLIFVVEAEKRHPREPFVFGRLRIQIKNDEEEEKGDKRTASSHNIKNSQDLLRAIASILPESLHAVELKKAKSSLSPASPATSPKQSSVEAAGGITLVARSKKKSLKKK